MIAVAKKLKKMSIKTKVKIIIALLLTAATFFAMPAFAWFNHNRQIAELQKVKTPDLLFISNACAEDVRTFDISTLQVSTEDGAPTSQSFPFAVAGEYVTSFTLQFAHTTNNPFVYKIYYGDILYYNNAVCTTPASARNAITALNAQNEEFNTNNPSKPQKKTDYSFATDVIEYKVGTTWSAISGFDRDTLYGISADETIYILKSECIKSGAEDGSDYLNAKVDNGRVIAKSDADYPEGVHNYHEDSYEDYDVVNKYAEPLYWQEAGISSVPESESESNSWGGNPFFRTFILDISWNPADISNKETDMLYLSAYRDD